MAKQSRIRTTNSPNTAMIQKALNVGKKQAQDVEKIRKRALQRRTAALKTVSLAQPTMTSLTVSSTLTAAFSQTAGILVAEGDSWFDYPLHDILKILEDDYGYDIESVAHHGDLVEDMAYGTNQLEGFARRLEKVLGRGNVPKAILLSGGGNDIAGDDFHVLLNHLKSASSGFNDKIVSGIIDERLQLSFITILSGINTICRQKINRDIPILIHGYDYPVPDGRGFLGGAGPLPGPWLEPGFRVKGYSDVDKNTKLVSTLINRFNEMLKRLSVLPPFSQFVKYVNLRNKLSNGPGYKQWWGNELHPTKRGFEEVTHSFVSVLQNLP